jgi:hypothetical protein
MQTNTDVHASDRAPIRRGVWLLPIAGIIPALLFTVIMLLPGGTDNPSDAQAGAQQLADPFSLVFGGVFIAALIGLILGFQALYAWLAGIGAARAWALTGLVLTVASATLNSMAWGAFTLAGKVVGDLYLSGHTGVVDAIQPLSGGSFGAPIFAALIGASILALLAAIAFGAALWRARAVPRWAAVALPLGFVLFSGSAPVVTPFGGLLMLAGGVPLARAVGREGLGQTVPTGLREASRRTA